MEWTFRIFLILQIQNIIFKQFYHTAHTVKLLKLTSFTIFQMLRKKDDRYKINYVSCNKGSLQMTEWKVIS